MRRYAPTAAEKAITDQIKHAKLVLEPKPASWHNGKQLGRVAPTGGAK